MKVLQVNCVYAHGSTGKIIADIEKVLEKKGHKSIICYGRGKTVNNKPGVYKFCSELESKIHNIAHRYFGVLGYGGCYFSTYNLINIIDKEKPDVVHLHCINGFCVNIFRLLKWLGENNIKTLLTNHAEFFYTGNCGHAYNCERWKSEPGCGSCPILLEATAGSIFDTTQKSWCEMKKAFSYFHENNLLCTAVSPWVKSRFLLSPITCKFNCQVVFNGLDTSIFNINKRENRELTRKSIGIGLSEKVVFHATAFFYMDENNLKGGRYIYKLAKLMPDVIFVVAALSYQTIIDCPPNLKLIGSAKSQVHLSELYAAADLTVITSKRETFSMITAESLCCGTPVVGFESGGPESISPKEYTEFVEYDNLESLQISINKWINKTDLNNNEVASISRSMYSKELMAEGYLRCYEQLINNHL